MKERPSMREGPTVLVYHPTIGNEIVDAMRAAGAPGTLVGCTSEPELARLVEDADVLMATHCDLTAVVGSRRLRWIQSLASGVEDWMHPPGPPRCPITRMTGVYEAYMAEYVFGFLLLRTQEVDRLRAAQLAREWNVFEKASLRGATIGVAGMGHVGSAVARCAAAFEMNVWGLCRERAGRAPDTLYQRVYGRAELSEFLAGLDVLVLSMPITPQTRGIIDEAALRTLPAHALVINISRGALVDEPALARALAAGELGGAVLDTFVIEPLPRESPLWDIPNVTISPHNAGAVHAEELGAICARNLKEFTEGRLPGPLVDLSRGY
jgi:phosphoglycerate dehydrogenase-like enzyme